MMELCFATYIDSPNPLTHQFVSQDSLTITILRKFHSIIHNDTPLPPAFTLFTLIQNPFQKYKKVNQNSYSNSTLATGHLYCAVENKQISAY